MKFYLGTASLLLLSISAYSQNLLQGIVYDASSEEPLIGAAVEIAGTGNGTVTDWEGKYTLQYEESLPLKLKISYIGYNDVYLTVTDDNFLSIPMEESSVLIESVEVKGRRISEKQKENPLTVESMDLIAIRETPSLSFYEGLGNLKDVDLTKASLAFTIINTRGFNSTSPVRSLQLIDGIDNQSPGLNFSLGNFLGTPELDVLKVDLIHGASSAYYGPNAFNGVIAIKTKDPFYHDGLDVLVKAGERDLLETGFRWADNFQWGAGKFGYKINFYYLSAQDWEADNYAATQDSDAEEDNPGGYDAVNIYGDENVDRSRDYTERSLRRSYPGLEIFHRRGYREVELVDYDTENIKANTHLYYRWNNNVTARVGLNFGGGNTVYQGDNRFVLKNVQFWQASAEISKPNQFFIRTYATWEDAGESYDAYFTALRLQELAASPNNFTKAYINYWRTVIVPRLVQLEGFPDPNNLPFDFEALDQALITYQDLLFEYHNETQAAANTASIILNTKDFYEPGTERFEKAFNTITERLPTDEDFQGTRFYDKSKLYHIHGEYDFHPAWADIKAGASARLYTPDSRGTILLDTGNRKITNWEFGIYGGIEKKYFRNKLKLNATVRMDKNENYNPVFSPALSAVYLPNRDHIFRISIARALRNPTLADQFLNYNVGRAVLAGNLEGYEGLATVRSTRKFASSRNPEDIVYFDIDPIEPEKVVTIEGGYRAAIFEKIWVDGGYYYSWYEDFIGYKLGVDLEYDPTFNFITKALALRVSANAETEVTTQGFNIGISYYINDYLLAGANYSWNVLNKADEANPIIPAYNTPEHKYNLTLNGRDLPPPFWRNTLKSLGFNISYKWINGYQFEGSPQFTGFIPTYDLLDAQLSFIFKKYFTLKIGASNILDNEVFLTYGGPRIGRLAYVSLLFEID